jgi:hypothetical protein
LNNLKNKRYQPPSGDGKAPEEALQPPTQKEWVPINKLRKDRLVEEVSK